MTRTTHVVMPSRTATLLVIAVLASAGAAALGAQSASATPGDPHEVWVCKYVQKPGEDEVLKRGKNPIHVDAASLTNDRGVAPQLGDTFSDGQLRSVVVSLEAQAPMTECPTGDDLDGFGGVSRPGSVTPTIPATTGTPSVPTAATATPTGAGGPATTVPAGAQTPPTSTTSTEPGTGLGGVQPPATVALAPIPALGEGAPDTGGLGQVAQRSGSTDVAIGVGLLALAGGLLTVRSRRRRASVGAV